MALTESLIDDVEIHPMDVVETVALNHAWDFDRLAEDQIALIVEGLWRSYSVTIAWSGPEDMLRLICSFDMDPPEHRLPALYEAMNLANDEVWDGGFGYWRAQRLMVWRYGLVLGGEAVVTPEQVDRIILSAVAEAERFYPAFQLVCWGDSSAAEAMDVAIGHAYGRA